MNTVFRILFLINVSTAAIADVWPHNEKSKWNEETESKYSTWIETKVGSDFLIQPGHVYSQMQIDCADLHYLLRIVFSWTNGLEFAINDPIHPGQILSSRSSRWDGQSDKVKTFIKYVMEVTSTQTLSRDTVLVPIDRSSIKPGVILLGDMKRGHSMMIKKINPSGIPLLLYGSLPAREFIYLSYHFPSPLNYFPMGPLTIARGGGFRRFRWPKDIKKSENQIPYASAEQIEASKNLDSFFDNVQNKIGLTPLSADDSINFLLDDLCSQVRVRANTITDAINFLSSHPLRRLSTEEDDRYSTFKRDESIRNLIKKLKSEYTSDRDRFSTSTLKRVASVLTPGGTNEDECLVDWAQNRLEPLGWIIDRFELHLISSRAQDSLSLRWGQK